MRIILLIAPSAWGDGDLSPGKQGVWVSDSSVSVPASPIATVVIGTIKKGKKKRVLEVDATLIELVAGPSAPAVLGVGARVNGVTMEPKASVLQLVECAGAT